MKKLIALLLVLCTLLSFTACDVLYEMMESAIGDSASNDQGTPDTDDGEGDDNKGEGDNKLPGNNDEKEEGEKPEENVKPEDNVTPEVTKTYKDFTISEKDIFTQYIGTVIPFIPNDEYYVEGYYDLTDYENGINFYTVGNTEAEFNAYLELFGEYELYETYLDDFGDTWYCYIKDDVIVDLSYYTYEGEDYVDVYVIVYEEKDDTPPEQSYLYTDFTAKEKALFESYFGFVIPFLPTNEYHLDDISYNDGSESTLALDYYTTGNTKEEFIAYNELFLGYELTEVYDFSDMLMYSYLDGETEIYVSYFLYEGEYCVDVCITLTKNVADGSYTYNDFTADEKALFDSSFGFTIPFIPNSEYFVEEYEYEDEVGVNFYAFGNTLSEYNAYLQLFDAYTFVESSYDDSGDVWYTYTYKGYYIDIAYYEYYNNTYLVDVYVYELADSDNGDSGNTGGGSDTNSDLITNAGAGLPTGANGVYDVDFTDADKVKDVTDQGYYLDGCPTTGSPAVLVIPIEFSDSLASSKGYTTDKLVNAFAKNGVTDYYSVYDYYYISSYGKLTLDITVLDYWFKPQYSSSYYYNATYDYYGESVAIGDQLILDEALAYLSTVMDLSRFDSDNNGIIDSVVLINTLDVGEEDFYWAYRYWNIYTDDYGYYYEYDGVSANDYVWASYQFLHDKVDANGESTYTDTSVMNTYTFIHEFAHVLGVDDYYDTEYLSDPMNGLDIMDSMTGDHNAYTKFNLGWITTSRLVVTNGSVTLTLEAFAKSGDTIIIANNWDPSLGAYQEYYVIMYYTNEGLNGGDDYGYFVRDGIVVYHVNASLFIEEYDGEIYYDVYNNNTDATSQYGTEDNLIEYVKSRADTYTYVEGDTLPSVTDDNGDILSYTFVVDEITSDYATITFSFAG